MVEPTLVAAAAAVALAAIGHLIKTSIDLFNTQVIDRRRRRRIIRMLVEEIRRSHDRFRNAYPPATFDEIINKMHSDKKISRLLSRNQKLSGLFTSKTDHLGV